MRKVALCALAFLFIGVYGKVVIASEKSQEQQTSVILADGNWDNFNKKKLDNFLLEAQNRPEHSSYAIFDFDNTTAFLDIEEAILVYQLENLRFSMTPDVFRTVIYKDIPKISFKSKYNNLENHAVNIDAVGADILDSYTWLYNNYEGFQGGLSLSEIKQTAHYKNFIVKMRYLYDAIGGSFEHRVSYPWVTYLFCGMSKDEVAKLAEDTIQWQSQQPIEKVVWQSPDSLAGQAGVVKTVWKNGFRLIPEMQDLYKKLQQAGVDVYVVSASALDVIKAIMMQEKYGFSIPASHIYAMHPLYDQEGKLTSSLDSFYPQTQGKGKTETINKFIRINYNNKGPGLVCGDSEGDQNMMSDFDDTRLVLIINRLQSPQSIIGKLSAQAVHDYKKDTAKILLQGRNENKGEFLLSQGTILSGTDKPVLLP